MRAATIFTAIAATLAVAFTASSCGDSEYEYSTESCYLVFDNSTHLDPTLQSAMNQLSPGVFCRITTSTESGATYFCFESNHGASSKSRADAVDLRRSIILGAYNKSGIIVGYGNLGSPATLYAYDSQCPNCYAEHGTPSYKMSMTAAGHAVCASCKREYDMNNGGIVAKGDQGKKLMRYRAVSTGTLGVLTVSSR